MRHFKRDLFLHVVQVDEAISTPTMSRLINHNQFYTVNPHIVLLKKRAHG